MIPLAPSGRGISFRKKLAERRLNPSQPSPYDFQNIFPTEIHRLFAVDSTSNPALPERRNGCVLTLAEARVRTRFDTLVAYRATAARPALDSWSVSVFQCPYPFR